MLINDYIQAIKKLGACEEAVKDAHNFKTSEELWFACERGDWMLWLIGRTINRIDDETTLRKLTLVKARCAKLVIHLMKDERSRKAVEVAERFGLSQASREELDSAAYAAAASAYASASYASAAYAASAAASADTAAAYAYASASYAAYASASASYAAYASASAAASAADAYADTDTDTSAADKGKVLKQCAEIVRAEYPNVDELFEVTQ